MAQTLLNERCEKIIALLMEAKDYVKPEILAKETKVSKRSVYYDIFKINEFLEEHSLSPLVIERSKGILLDKGEKEALSEILNQKQAPDTYIFLPLERVKIMYCYLVQSTDSVYVQDFMELCQVSRNTIFSDLKVLAHLLRESNLDLGYGPKVGYEIIGDTVQERSLFLLYFSEVRYLYDSGIFSFGEESAKKYFIKLEALETRLKCKYVEGNLLALSLLLPSMEMGRKPIFLEGLKERDVMQKQEFKLVQREFGNLPVSEQFYLTLHLLGSRVTQAKEDYFADEFNEETYRLTKNFVAEFERIACLGFDDKESLERSLFLHLCMSMYRYRFGILADPFLSADIIKEYGHLFQLTKSAAKYLERSINLPIADNEVALLSLHFGAHLRIGNQKKNLLRIVIVCVNGIATTNMIKREVAQLLPDAIIKNVLYHDDLSEVEEDYDLIISSIFLKSEKPLIQVRPILSKTDKRRILSHPVVSEWLKKLRKEEFVGEGVDLLSLLTKKKIQIINKSANWTDAIFLGGAPLVDCLSISPSYLDKIIFQTKERGNYMFIADGIFLAHASPEDGVKHLDIALAIFPKPVMFPKEEPCTILWVLAAEDQERHLQVLKDIFVISSNKEAIETLVSLKTGKDVLNLIMETVQ